MAALSCFRVRFSDQKSLAPCDRMGFTTTTMNDIPYNSLLLIFNVHDKSISVRVIDQNQKSHMKTL